MYMVEPPMNTPDRDNINKILEAIKRELSKHYGDHLLKTIMYGSYARGTNGPGSDIDIAVILDGDIDKYEEVEEMVDITNDISLENDIMISLLPLTNDEYENGRYSIFFNIRKEGITI